MAVCMHLDSPAAPAENTAPASLPETAHENEEEVRAPIPQRREVLVEAQPGFGPRPRRRVARSVFDGFRDFQAEARQQAEMQAAAAVGGTGGDPPFSGTQKRRTLEDLFRPPIDLLHKGTFETAKEAGCKTNKWLMVNVQNVKEFQCQVLNRDVWSNEAVRSLIKRHFILWQVYSDSHDGMRFSRFYEASTWPYIAVLDPQTGEKLVTWTHSDPMTFCDLVGEFLLTHSSPSGPPAESPPVKRKKEASSVVDISEDDQLQAAIRASLAESVASISEDDDDEGDSCCIADDLETFSGSEDDNSRDSITKKTPKLETNGVDKKNNWKEFLGSDEDPKCKVMFRFPNGKRSQISFPESSSLRALVEYVIEEGFSNERYELLTTFPRRKLSHLNFDDTLKQLGLPSQETIFVQER
ncbi:hypothetical protein CAPTEDRAFT_20428 [Capitella teleta]|uniref:UBX domain-containing protein n=1 Tax=Capitella teleta TaxID=283909 RepID=R7TMN0_CAPTE|nr:hypothetical protein CAPTEDRAFT_20428 [Capitella teleta]|eukprot:ELT92791.1 hypothetical protein CAPTEDRAFT_20428 [Capitella teleta]